MCLCKGITTGPAGQAAWSKATPLGQGELDGLGFLERILVCVAQHIGQCVENPRPGLLNEPARLVVLDTQWVVLVAEDVLPSEQSDRH